MTEVPPFNPKVLLELEQLQAHKALSDEKVALAEAELAKVKEQKEALDKKNGKFREKARQCYVPY